MRPLIGVTVGSQGGRWPDGGTAGTEAARALCLDGGYARAIEAAGGIPALLPPQDPAGAGEILARLDGLLLPGGPDLDPLHFGEEPLPETGRIDPERDIWELALAHAALAGDVPVLGICRGIQVMNVAAGGGLYQDIARQARGALKHQQDAPRWYPTHSLTVQPGSRLAALLAAPPAAPPGEGMACAAGGGPPGGVSAPLRIRVNSFHHQAVWEVAPGFIACARAPDGIVEAVERPGATFALGVQWHPEGMWEREAGAFALFRGLVAASRGRGGL